MWWGPVVLSCVEECRDLDLSDGRVISIRREKKNTCQEGEQREARWGFDRGSAGGSRFVVGPKRAGTA